MNQRCYREGRAYELFHRAVDAENITAMFNLALLHLDAESGYHDERRGEAILKKCALAGFAEAQELLREMPSPEMPHA